jgi:hypothetical protein
MAPPDTPRAAVSGSVGSADHEVRISRESAFAAEIS